MPDRDGWLSIDEAAARYGVHRQTVAKRAATLDPAAKRKDPRGRWLLDPAAVERVTGWTAAVEAPPTAAAPQQGTTALQLLDQLAPLLQRVANAERERADAEARARIAEHERDQALRRLAEQDVSDQTRASRTVTVALMMAALMVALGVGLLTVAGTIDDQPVATVSGVSGAVTVLGALVVTWRAWALHEQAIGMRSRRRRRP